jgi:chemotaxis protein MotB
MSRLGLCRLTLAAVVLTTGCQLVPKSQVTECEHKSRALAEQSKAQLAEIANLKAHAKTVENQLMQAEQELALVEERTGLDRKRLSNYERERRQLRGQVDGLRGNLSKAGADRRLLELCDKYPALRYDEQTGVCKFDSDVLFESGDATLSPDSRRQLTEFAKLLSSPEARDFHVMVVGHTDNRPVAKRDTRDRFPDNWHLSAARALAVADYLQRSGLRENQVGVAGFGRHEPISANATPGDRQLNRRVEIFVAGPETPVVGWTETLPNLYR